VRPSRTAVFAPLAALSLSCIAFTQDQPAAPPAAQKTPEIHVTYLNVCAPDDGETKELTSALARIPLQPPFSSDFEVARGRSSVTGGEIAARLTGGNLPPSTWVRLRREFASGFFANVQYSMTRDENGLFEVLVFRVRDPKELMQVAFTDSVNHGNPTAVLATDTPPSRIKLERFGKSSVGLSRCPAVDQKQYEPLFRSAARVMAAYRDLLGARKTVPAEFTRLGAPKAKAAAPKPAASAAPPQKP
jgi:hypothetical protein